MRITIPTILTLFRIVLLPVMVIAFYAPFQGANIAAAAIFIAAAITDWLDGWIARRYDMGSAFGAFLDPVADKLMVAVTLFLLVQENPTPLMAVTSAIIVGREISISALREWMAEIGQRAHRASRLARQDQDGRCRSSRSSCCCISTIWKACACSMSARRCWSSQRR